MEGEGIESPSRISLTKLEAGKSEVSSELPEGQEQAHIDLGEPSTAPFPHLTLALGYQGCQHPRKALSTGTGFLPPSRLHYEFQILPGRTQRLYIYSSKLFQYLSPRLENLNLFGLCL